MTEDYKQMKKEIEKFVKEHKKELEEAIKESFTLECKKINELEKERDKLNKKLGTKEIQLANAEFDLHFEEMKTRELKQENERIKSALEEIRITAGQRFVSNLNEEADCYNTDMEHIESIINEVIG